MRRFLFLLAIALALSVPSAARADISYQYVSDQSTYNLTQSTAAQSITVSLYLQETLTSGSQSLIVADGGMFAAALSSNRSSGTTASITAIKENTGSPWTAGSFAFGADNFTASSAQLGVQSPGNLGVASNINPDSTGKILIGTMTLTIAANATGTTTFNLAQYNTGGGNTVTSGSSNPTSGSAFDLDFTNNQSPATGGFPVATYKGTNDNPFSFTVVVAAVPEPSSMTLCGMAVLGGAYSVYRRRKAQAASAAVAA